jgi:hypothetical protein
MYIRSQYICTYQAQKSSCHRPRWHAASQATTAVVAGTPPPCSAGCGGNERENLAGLPQLLPPSSKARAFAHDLTRKRGSIGVGSNRTAQFALGAGAW